MRLSLAQSIKAPATLNYLADSAYDYTKWNLGKSLIKNADNTISPHFDAIRPLEESTGFAVQAVFTINFSTTYDYVFGIENSVAATATRRIHMWTINKKTGARSWNGYITITLATATAHTVRDFKIDRIKESTGTVSASGTAVTGVGTLFVTNRVALGARIGFGSTDPSQIATWYRISAIAADGGLTLATSAGTVNAGSAYVIEDYRPVYVATNATTTNGGIHYGKGITPEDYVPTGTTIALAVSTDAQKAIYWLKDASTQTNLVAAGCACDFLNATPTNLDCYVLDLVVAGNYKVYKYNLRAALTVLTGASTNAFVLVTGQQPITGTGSQSANLCIATTNHGTGNGVRCLYCVSTTRVMRIPVSAVVNASTTFIADSIVEIPPGGATSYTVPGAMASIEYIGVLDKFMISNTSVFNYLTQYVASGSEFNEIWGRGVNALEQTTKNSNIPLTVSIHGLAMFMNDSDNTGLVYLCKNSTTAGIHVIYIVNIGAHLDSTGNYSLISPEIATPNALRYYMGCVSRVRFVGSALLGRSVEKIDIYARTANIRSDMTTGWTLLNDEDDLSSFAGASAIQIKIVYKTLGDTGIPAKIFGLQISYEDNTTDSHFAASVSKSDLANKRFGFWFKTAFGGTVPKLFIRLYDADSGGLLLTDDTIGHTGGTFEKSTDGTNWVAYNTNDRTNATNYIRYTPTSLADNIKVAAYLSQA